MTFAPPRLQREGFRWRDLVVGVPLLVWLLTACFGAALAGWSVLTPLYQSPDEPLQVDRVVAAAAGDVLPAPEGRRTATSVVRSEQLSGVIHCCPPRQTSYPLEQAPPHGARPSFDQLGGATPDPKADYDWLDVHPPLYYLWEAGVERALPEMPYDFTVVALRLAGALLVLPVPLLLFVAARRLTGSPGPVAVTAAALPLAVPHLSYLGASVENDMGLVLAGALLTALLAYVLTGDLSRRTAAWVGLTLGAALLTKAFGFFAVPAIVLAYVFAAWRAGRWRPALGGLIISGGISAAVGGWYWVRMIVLYGSFQPTSGIPLPGPAPPSFHPSLVHYFFHGYPARMMTTFFGEFDPVGFFDTGYGAPPEPLATAVIAVLVGVLLLGVVLAFRRRPRRDRPWSWADALVLVLPAALLYAAVGEQAWHGYVKRASLGANQGRYLYLGLAGLLLAVALAAARLPRRWHRWLPLTAGAAAAALQGYSVVFMLHRYWSSGSNLGHAVHAMIAWSPYSISETIAFGAAVTALCAATLVVAAVRPLAWTPRSEVSR